MLENALTIKLKLKIDGDQPNEKKKRVRYGNMFFEVNNES
jgi:hypothetical protein